MKWFVIGFRHINCRDVLEEISHSVTAACLHAISLIDKGICEVEISLQSVLSLLKGRL